MSLSYVDFQTKQCVSFNEMAASAPLYRRLAIQNPSRCAVLATPSLTLRSSRLLSSTMAQSGVSTSRTYAGAKIHGNPDKEHATDKKDKLDVQSESSHKGRE